MITLTLDEDTSDSKVYDLILKLNKATESSQMEICLKSFF